MSGTPATEHVHYVRGAGQAVAIVKRAAGTLQTRYLHRDHLGSVVALTDASGAVLERYSYDPWGKRRDAATWASPAPGTFPIDPAYSDRGYTGHEHIDHVGLINMNGRIYDPEIGRFLSADPTTQFPESTQGWNRYSYCGNNPLSYVDPSGFSFWKSLMKVVGIVMSVFAPQLTPLWQQMLWSFASGYLSSGGNLQGGLMAMAFVGLGKWSAGLSQAGAPAGTLGGTPGINPSGGFSLTAEEAAEVAGTAAERSMRDKIIEVVRRTFRALQENDASHRTNRARASVSDAGQTSAFARAMGSFDFEPGSRAADAGVVLARDPSIPDSVKIGAVGIAVVGTVAVVGGVLQGTVFLVALERAQAIQGIADGVPPGFGAARGATTVYRSVDAAGKVQYVGITNNLARRAAEHLRGSGIQVEKLMGNLSRTDARAVEQTLIEIHGLGKNGGTLLNRINSISPSNPAYADQLKRGYELLQTIGY